MYNMSSRYCCRSEAFFSNLQQYIEDMFPGKISPISLCVTVTLSMAIFTHSQNVSLPWRKLNTVLN